MLASNTTIDVIISKLPTDPLIILTTILIGAVNGYTLLPISLLRQLRTDDITTQQLENKTALLTQKELEILESVSKGSSNKQIADELYMSSRAVEYNLTKIFKKLKVGSRSEALTEAMRQGILKVHI